MAEASTTSLELPPSLPYPIRINRILASPSSSVKRGNPLFEYTFTSDSSRKILAKGGGKDESGQQAREWDMVGTFESRVEGTVERWEEWVKLGATIERKYAGRPVIWLEQPCTHPVQLHGMCAICGKDLTSDDYLSRPAEEQAGPSKYPGSFEMSHDALGVTVSTKEAKRLENQTRDTLLGSKRLSLIVDLDQTIIHTTVDPTVGEWMAEMDETNDSAKAQSTTNGESTTPPGSPRTKGKPTNPNAHALRDVARFQLPDELPPGYSAKIPDRNYYTKPRPGVQDFLERMNVLYEMHVYTMGTRSYAEAICKVVDPEGKYFGGRIISRDENRNFSSKNLKRLFPTDQSMVVVIDDRADVWGDIPNLVKVVPYDFFIGIGDINSGFLPPVPTSPASTASAMPVTPTDEVGDSADSANTIAQTKMLDAVSEERPLAKLQEDLESESASSRQDGGTTEDEDQPATLQEANGSAAQPSANGAQTGPRRPLLTDNDDELQRVARILGEIHSSFYRAYSRRTDKALNAPLPLGCDVEVIVPDIKSRVLEGCSIVFSGVIPKQQRPEQSEIFATAEAFGARPMLDVSPNMTHCVTAALGTEKTHRALKMGAFVVWVDWFHKSVALWERQDEREFPAGPDAGPSRSSSRPDTPQMQVDAEPNGQSPNGAEENKAGDVDMPDWEGDDNLMEGKEWDDNDDAELRAFMDGASDYGEDGTEAGDTDSRMGDDPPVPSPPVTAPGSPSKKRVRYADEESLPLESFQDPPENADGTDSPPKKRLLLMAPGEDDEIPPEHRYQWRGKMKREQEEREKAEKEAAAQAGTDDGEEDLFAQMLEDSMGD